MKALLVKFALLRRVSCKTGCIFAEWGQKRKAWPDRNELRREQAVGGLTSPAGASAVLQGL